MQAGERISYNGYQVCLFPMDYLYCTQVSSPDSYSHCCGHPADWIGPSAEYPIYAPFDCHLVHSYPDGNNRVYTSDNKVWTPQGLDYVTVLFTHDNNPPSATSFSQGDLIAHTGTAGFVTGDHTHIDQSNVVDAALISYGYYCSGGNLCYALDGSQYPANIFYLSGNETIITTLGQGFETWDKPPGPGPGPGSNLAKFVLLSKYTKRRKQNVSKRFI